MSRLNIPSFQNGPMTTYFHKGHGLSIHHDGDEVWLKATVNLAEGAMVEYLRCLNLERGIFKLLSREVESAVPTMAVVKRHNQFKIGQVVRMKVNAKSRIHTP